jgi:hypothetical protein
MPLNAAAVLRAQSSMVVMSTAVHELADRDDQPLPKPLGGDTLFAFGQGAMVRGDLI